MPTLCSRLLHLESKFLTLREKRRRRRRKYWERGGVKRLLTSWLTPLRSSLLTHHFLSLSLILTPSLSSSSLYLSVCVWLFLSFLPPSLAVSVSLSSVSLHKILLLVFSSFVSLHRTSLFPPQQQLRRGQVRYQLALHIGRAYASHATFMTSHPPMGCPYYAFIVCTVAVVWHCRIEEIKHWRTLLKRFERKEHFIRFKGHRTINDSISV